jgi:hypothetical protein
VRTPARRCAPLHGASERADTRQKAQVEGRRQRRCAGDGSAGGCLGCLRGCPPRAHRRGPQAVLREARAAVSDGHPATAMQMLGRNCRPIRRTWMRDYLRPCSWSGLTTARGVSWSACSRRPDYTDARRARQRRVVVGPHEQLRRGRRRQAAPTATRGGSL